MNGNSAASRVNQLMAQRFVDSALQTWSTAAELNNASAKASEANRNNPSVSIGNGAGHLSLSLPRLPLQTFNDWLGRRLIWWPAEPLLHTRVAVVSSRIGKRRDLHRWWFDTLRTVVIRSNAESECICIIDGTAPAAAVARACELFGIRRLRIDVSDAKVSSAADLADWLNKVATMHHARKSYNDFESFVFVSPEFAEHARMGEGDSVQPGTTSPIADVALVAAAERIVSLSCRPNGNIENLLTRRLTETNSGGVLVLTSSTEGSPAVPEALRALGAIPWLLENRQRQAVTESIPVNSTFPRAIKATSSDGPIDRPGEWLSHWTRPVPGPWHDQPEDEFLDELILGCASADRSALAALIRLITLAFVRSSVSTKNKPPTVSFTAVPLHKFRQRRIFRAHRQRFDFEPWGVAIRKTALLKIGAEAVEYIDEVLPDSNRESRFTQRRFDAKGRIDWSEEQEWRIDGDLSFSNLSKSDIHVFVDSELEASILRPFSAWPIAVVPAGLDQATRD